ncbi:Rtf2 RING-finger-domain-containing protein [Haematococcus lacustris]
MVQLFVRAASTMTVSCSLEQDDVKALRSRVAQLLPGSTAENLVLTHCGRCLRDNESLLEAGLVQGSTLFLSTRLVGGGGDGGSTGAESRSCYLEMYLNKKPDKVNPAEEQLARYTQCTLSGAPLLPPCVIDELGMLYNKDAMVEALLAKSLPEGHAYITGLKSLVELKLTVNPEAAKHTAPKAAEKGLHQPSNEAAFSCPVAGVPFNGRFKFIVHRPTGWVLSEKAVKEAPSVVAELLGSNPAGEDWIPVNPSGEQVDELKAKLAAKLAAERERKARKKAGSKAATGAAAAADKAAALELQPAVQPDLEGRHKPAVAVGAVLPAVGGRAIAAATAAAVTASAAHKLPAPALPAHTAPQPGMPAAKKAKVMETMPQHATSKLYASLFTSSIKNPVKETYCCRSTSARGMNLG